MVGDKVLWYPECVLPLPPLKKNSSLAAQLDSPFGGSCLVYSLMVICIKEIVEVSFVCVLQHTFQHGLRSCRYQRNRLPKVLLAAT